MSLFHKQEHTEHTCLSYFLGLLVNFLGILHIHCMYLTIQSLDHGALVLRGFQASNSEVILLGVWAVILQY